MEPTDEGFKLSTGLTFYAHASILGLGPEEEGERLQLTYGYDGGVDPDRPWGPTDRQFTPAERQEIAAYMVDLWTKWAAQPPVNFDESHSEVNGQ